MGGSGGGGGGRRSMKLNSSANRGRPIAGASAEPLLPPTANKKVDEDPEGGWGEDEQVRGRAWVGC